MPELRHIVRSQQFTEELISEIFALADILNPKMTYDYLKGKIGCMLFYEPSTRTRMSFESAVLRLGGQCISTENANIFSSVAKGESLEDTVRIVSGYSDIIVLRHPQKGSAEIAAAVAKVPIINGGDGADQHPTQALLDLYTIRCRLHRIENLKIVAIGDLRRGRTIRSLCYLLAKFKGHHFVFLSPESLRIGDDIKEYLTKHCVTFEEHFHLHTTSFGDADVIYDTRIQTERDKDNPEEAKRLLQEAEEFILKEEHLPLMSKNCIVMHPLPRVRELPIDPDRDPRLVFIEQANYYGVKIRMALLCKIMEIKI